MSRTRTALLACTAALGLALTACGGNSNDTGAQGGNNNGGSAVSLAVATIPNIGQVVTDAGGRTLYRFDEDKNNPPTTTCVDSSCTSDWPPLVTTSDTVSVQGVDQSLVGTITRPDGSKQVTLAGWPLYTFRQDKGPGTANGQGLEGTWFAASPTGDKASGAAPAPSESDDGGYTY